MNYEPGFPKTMVHPSYRPAIISDAAANTADAFTGSPARFLPQMVHTPDEEQDMRARGYLNPGEPPPQPSHHAEYPKFLRHPEHSDAVPAMKRSIVVGDEVKIVDVPARAELYPDKIVENSEEEGYWRRQGWGPAGRWDEKAFERAHTTPEVAYHPLEWPKYIDGKVYEDPNAVPAEVVARQAHEYPKWVNGREIANAEEEAAVLANSGEPVLANPGSSAPVVGNPLPSIPEPPQALLDVVALKREIVAEIGGQLKDMLREALTPQAMANPAINPVTEKPRRTLSPEHRAALLAGRAAARERRKANADHQESQYPSQEEAV